jgi:hypothetical protein
MPPGSREPLTSITPIGETAYVRLRVSVSLDMGMRHGR